MPTDVVDGEEQQDMVPVPGVQTDGQKHVSPDKMKAKGAEGGSAPDSTKSKKSKSENSKGDGDNKSRSSKRPLSIGEEISKKLRAMLTNGGSWVACRELHHTHDDTSS